MKTIELKDGGRCTHNYSEGMIQLAMNDIMEYFSDGKEKSPSDLEDDFTGMRMILQECGQWIYLRGDQHHFSPQSQY